MVGFPKDVEEVYFTPGAILDSAAKDTLLIDMTTTSPTLAKHIAEEGAQRGLRVGHGSYAGYRLVQPTYAARRRVAARTGHARAGTDFAASLRYHACGQRDERNRRRFRASHGAGLSADGHARAVRAGKAQHAFGIRGALARHAAIFGVHVQHFAARELGEHRAQSFGYQVLRGARLFQRDRVGKIPYDAALGFVELVGQRGQHPGLNRVRVLPL